MDQLLYSLLRNRKLDLPHLIANFSLSRLLSQPPLHLLYLLKSSKSGLLLLTFNRVFGARPTSVWKGNIICLFAVRLNLVLLIILKCLLTVIETYFIKAAGRLIAKIANFLCWLPKPILALSSSFFVFFKRIFLILTCFFWAFCSR